MAPNTWKRMVTAYLGGFVVLSAGLVVTTTLGIWFVDKVLLAMPPMAYIKHPWAMGSVPLATILSVNFIAFFLAGAVVGAVVRHNPAVHALVFGLSIGALGLILSTTTALWRSELHDTIMVCVVFAVVGVIGTTAGGLFSLILQKRRGRPRILTTTRTG